MTIVGLNHVSITVRDLAASLAFYEGLLGLSKAERPAMRVDGAWLTVGHSQIHLIVGDESLGDTGRPPAATNPAGPHTALTVADFDATVNMLTAAGLEPVRGSGSRRQCWVQDPDGYVVELIAG
jgi:catechol 2,3-dioxygenase-like lactoylglutathione lyase family enzyme